MDIRPEEQFDEDVGHLMRETVRNAAWTIRQMRFSAETRRKDEPDGKEDFVTDADVAAQEGYVRVLRTHLPEFGIVAEEDGLAVPCTHPARDLWFTIDPLDGTKAFVRRQSHGIGTMIALVSGGDVIAAYVGDVMADEIYGYGPGASEVVRGDARGLGRQTLRIDPARALVSQHVMLRSHPLDYSMAVQAMVGLAGDARRNRFRGMVIDTGSIGVDMARLWKGEVGMVCLKPQRWPPWDLCPILGISRKLGFVFVPVLPREFGSWTLGEDCLAPTKAEQRIDHDIIVVHASRRDELQDLFCDV